MVEAKSPPSIVTPGNHDGVHLGHRALIDAAKRQAQAQGLRTLAMCFDPHPTRILAPERAPVLLTSMARRVEILRAAGCDDVVVLPFDEEFARTAPSVFVERVLLGACNAKGVVVGPDFQFGHRRAGNVETLRKLGQQAGFSVEVVEPVMHNGASVSSTRIRRVLREAGDVQAAAAMLTRVHDVEGSVIRGDQRGRSIGFPTANLEVADQQLPVDGVYAVVVKDLHQTGGPRHYQGVANLGVRPTFEAGRSVEVHLFDFDADLYGHRLRVGFVARIRGEQKFDGIDAIKAQISKDCKVAADAISAIDPELLRWV